MQRVFSHAVLHEYQKRFEIELLRKRNYASMTVTSMLMLFREVIAFSSSYHTNTQMYTVGNVKNFLVKIGGK